MTAVADNRSVDADSPTPESNYWSESRTPLASFLFLLPLILLYEFGVLLMGQDQPETVRNGADYWMRSLLSQAGFEQILLPVLVLAVLLIWHFLSRQRWTVSLETQAGMLAESLLLAVLLVAAGQSHDFLFRCLAGSGNDGREVLSIGPVTRAVSFIGAGVYEEVMFRLLLVPVACFGFRLFEFPVKWAAVMAALSTSFLFAMAHHVGPSADAFNLFAFSFRAGAGLFFASVFLLRGFGITVGCHAAYDVLVGVLLAA